jgi:hypothetical protein
MKKIENNRIQNETKSELGKFASYFVIVVVVVVVVVFCA